MVATMSQEFCTYVSIKIDDKVLPIVKAAAALDNQPVQEWISDQLNQLAASRANQKPVKRRQPKPRKPKSN